MAARSVDSFGGWQPSIAPCLEVYGTVSATFLPFLRAVFLMATRGL